VSDNDQTALTIEGERIRGKQLTVSAEVPMDGLRKLGRHEKFAYVGRGIVDEWGIKDVSKVPTRVHKGHATEAVIVADELVEDILGEHVEWTTGQMRLLSVDGEMRRAARLALDERRRQLTIGHTIESDDEQQPSDFAACITGALKKLDDACSAVDSFESIPAYFDAIEHELRQVSATAMAGMEWTRRRLEEHLAAEERAEAERAAAARAEEAAKNGEVTDAMAVHADEDADKRERREVDDSDIEEGSEFDGPLVVDGEQKTADEETVTADA
jgi:hypothetical protein